MIDKVIKITREAGEIAREGFGKSFDVEFKSNSSDLVTEYDKKAEKVITDFIKKEFSGHSILAEESGEKNFDSEYRWVIDPIDGTTNFAHGVPIFSVSVGVQKNGKTICGAVYDVMQNSMYTAEHGSGAFRNGKKIEVSNNVDLEKSLLVTGFPYNLEKYMPEIVEKFSKILNKSRAVRRLGSAAIDLCYVAAGIFDGFWELELQQWDMCAGNLMVEEAGGKVTDFSGNHIKNSSTELLVTNGKIHESIREILSS